MFNKLEYYLLINFKKINVQKTTNQYKKSQYIPQFTKNVNVFFQTNIMKMSIITN